MKKPKKIGWISVGAKRSFADLLTWFGDGRDKEVTKKRIIILSCVAGGAILLTVKVPAVGPIVIVVLVLGVFAWWGRWPHEEMTMKYSDFSGSVQIGDKAHPSMEILRKYIEAHPGEDAAQLARRLSEAPGSPGISPALMRGVMRELDLEPKVNTERKAKAKADKKEGKTCVSPSPEAQKAADVAEEPASPQVNTEMG